MRIFAPLLLVLLLASACKNSYRLFGKGEVLDTSAPRDTTLVYEESGRLIILPVEIEGQTYRFLFDTGAPMVVSPELVDRFELKALREAQVRDSQGRRDALRYVQLPPLSLGGFTVKDLVAIEADLQRSVLIRCLNIDGILGANFFHWFYWQIRADRKEICISRDWESLRPDSSFTSLPFRIKNTRTPVIDYRWKGGLWKDITFDTGSGGGLSLPASAWPDSLGELADACLSFGYQSAGLFGSTSDTSYQKPHYWLAHGDTLAAFSLELSRQKNRRLLGMEMLEQVDCRINWQEQRIYLGPLPEARRSFQLRAFGASPYWQDSTLIIGALTPHLLPLDLNLQLGDTILAVNGFSTQNLSPEGYCEMREHLRDQDSLKLVMQGGDTLQLVKQNYFEAFPGGAN